MKTDRNKKKDLAKTIALTAFRATVLYLAYNHVITPRQVAIPRETQKGLWMSVKNAWKMSRFGVRMLRKSR